MAILANLLRGGCSAAHSATYHQVFYGYSS